MASASTAISAASTAIKAVTSDSIINIIPSLSSTNLTDLISTLTNELEKLTLNKDMNVGAIRSESVEKKSRGKNSFKYGNEYERKIHSILSRVTYNGESFIINANAGAKAGSDIVIKTAGVGEGMKQVGFEVKDAGAFEGGAKKLTYCNVKKTLCVQENSIHKDIIGDRILYGGANFPWYCDKKGVEDWKAVEDVFKPEIYIDAPSDAVANYYKRVGTHYIQIEKYGLFHTGLDILDLGVPFFTTNIRLRIRSSKHIKNGIPTDITAALQYDKKALPKSPYSLDGLLPPSMRLVATADAGAGTEVEETEAVE